MKLLKKLNNSLNYPYFLLTVFLLSMSSFTFCANTHISSFHTDPATLRANQDFTLFFTLKNDMEIGIDNISMSFECSDSFVCPANTSTSMSSYGLVELAIPIQNNAISGLHQINLSWTDGSYNMGLDENQTPLSTSKTLKNTFTLLVRQSAISSISSTTNLIFNQKNNFNINISAHDLNNVRVSLYSSCMAFDNSLFYFSSLNKTTSLDTSVFVNCKPGSADLSLTLQSDELNAQIPLGVYVQKIPQSNLELEFLSPSIYCSKDNLQIKLTNNKESAEKLYLMVLPTSTIRSSDMLYLGDFQNERIAYVQVQAQEVGNQPISIEARWVENGVPFTKVWQKIITVNQKPPAQIPSSFIASIIGLVILCIIWMTYSKTSISFFKKG